MKIIIFLLFIIFCSISLQGAITPQEIISFEIPELNGTIEKIKFNDVDGDGFPEVLVSDGERIVLYSYSLDSVLFYTNLDIFLYPNKVRYQIEYSDINRDSIPDIIVGYFLLIDEFTHKVAIISFDGKSNFNISDTVLHTPGLGYMWYSETNGVTALQAIDLNSDGYNELIYSYESLYYSFFKEETNGYTYLFYGFPDSLLWGKNYNTSNFKFLNSDSIGNIYITTRYKVTVYDWPGVNVCSINVYPSLVRNNGDIIKLNLLTNNKYNNFSYSSGTNITSIECIGIINSNPLGVNVILSNWWSSYYEEYDSSGDSLITGHSSGSKQSLFEMKDDNSAEEIWNKEGTNLSSFLFKPDIPGYFFAFEDNILKQFNGIDGSLNQECDTIFDGIKLWEYPFDENEPMLVVLDSNKVSLFNFDITTDINDTDNHFLPASFTLSQNYPNPFNPNTKIEYSIPSKGHVNIIVYNIIGQKVAVLVDDIKDAGNYSVEWNSKDISGNKVSSGIYLIKADYNNQSKVIKSLLLK